MIYEGVLWVLSAIGRLFNYALSIKLIGNISLLEISIGLSVVFLILDFMSLGLRETHNVVPYFRFSNFRTENAKQKKKDREYVPKHEYMDARHRKVPGMDQYLRRQSKEKRKMRK